MNSPGAPPLLRRLNSALVLRTIRADGPLSRADLARATGLSKPTVNQVVEDLLAERWIAEGEADPGSLPVRRGRRARPLAFRADLGYVLGVDIGADKVLALVADAAGAILASSRRRTAAQARGGPEAVLAEVREAMRDALATAQVPQQRLKAVGVGTPGVVDPASGRISLAPQLAGWDGLDLGHQIGQWYACPVLVDGETHLSLLAERRVGVVQSIDDAVYVHIGVGISCGILVGGAIYRGVSGAAGEIGYLPLVESDSGPPDLSIEFEQRVSGGAFARRGRTAASLPGGELLRQLAGDDPLAVDAEIIFAAAKRGDPAAVAIIDEITSLLARGIAAVVATLNPSTVIVGGGVSRAGMALLTPLATRVRAMVPVPPQFVLSTLGDEAVALGALQLALQVVDEELFGAPARQ